MLAFYHLFTPQLYLHFACRFYIASNSVFPVVGVLGFFKKKNKIHWGLKLKAGSCSSSLLSPGYCFCTGIAEVGREMEERDPEAAGPWMWENPAQAALSRSLPRQGPAPRAALGQIHVSKPGAPRKKGRERKTFSAKQRLG